jgi:hypothetical protein
MPASRDQTVITATLDNVSHGSAINLQVGGNVPAEVRRSDHYQTTTRLTRSFAKRKPGEEDKNQKTSADVDRSGSSWNSFSTKDRRKARL